MLRKKSLLTVWAAILAVGVGGSSAQSAGEKIKLRLRLKKGESYKLRMTTDQKISQTIQGKQVDMSQTMGIGFTYHVREVDADGTAAVKLTYDSVLFKQDGPLGKIEYDSSNPPETVHPMAKGFAALTGQSFSMRLSPQGQIKSVEGVDAMFTRVMQNIDVPDARVKATLEKKLKQQFGDDALKEMMENTMAIYPDKPVAIGDSWSKKVVVTKGFAITLENTWTLKDRKDGVAVVDVQSKITPSQNAKPIEMGMMKVRQDISGSQEGQMEISEATGWPVRAGMTQKLSGKMHVEQGPGPLKDQSWPITIESDIRITSPEK